MLVQTSAEAKKPWFLVYICFAWCKDFALNSRAAMMRSTSEAQTWTGQVMPQKIEGTKKFKNIFLTFYVDITWQSYKFCFSQNSTGIIPMGSSFSVYLKEGFPWDHKIIVLVFVYLSQLIKNIHLWIYSGKDSVDNCLDPLDCWEITDKSFGGLASTPLPPVITPPARPLIWSVSAICMKNKQ